MPVGISSPGNELTAPWRGVKEEFPEQIADGGPVHQRGDIGKRFRRVYNDGDGPQRQSGLNSRPALGGYISLRAP